MDEDLVSELRAEIERLEAEVERRRTAEQQAIRELEAFSHSISHDLRAPLRIIDGYSKILLDEYGPALPEEGRDYLHAVRRGVHNMAALIDGLLAFSRLARQPLEREEVDTQRLVQDALDAVWAQYPGRQEDVRLGPLPPSWGDRSLLKQVWYNLLANAYKFTSRTSRPQIEVGASNGEAPTFYVRDNGAGFDPEYGHKLFAVFHRLHAAGEFPGVGVGLAIVHRIVSRHGGRVWAEAAPDKGATFYFQLAPRPG